MPGALGRHPLAAQNHDPRSLRFLVPPSTTVESKDWQRQTPVLDQGNLGSCTGNAAVGVLGTTPFFEAFGGNRPNLDENLAVTLYSDATHLDPYPGTYLPTDTGSDGLSVAKAAKNNSLISGYLHATSLAEMQSALQVGPVIVGVNWYEGFDSPDANGLVKVSGSVRGGHEFEVVGLDVTKQLFHAVNSWGTSWGVNGHFWFSFADMTRLLSEGGDCTQFVPISSPAPTPTPIPAADQAVIDAYNAWSPSILSRFTKAAKLKAAIKNWAKENGYQVNGV